MKKKLFCCIVYIALPVIIVEFFSLLILNGRIKDSLHIFRGIMLTDQNILEIIHNSSIAWKTKEFNCTVKTNSRGYREEFDFEDKSVDVAFMGDSFAFGHGVDVANRYSNIAAKLNPDIRIVSLSYNNGFEPEHYEYFLDHHPELKPKLLFIGVYLGNDFDSDLAETVIIRKKDGEIDTLQLPYREIYQNVMINKSSFKNNYISKIVQISSVGKLLAAWMNASQKLRYIIYNKDAVLPNTPNKLSVEYGKLNDFNMRSIFSLVNINKIMTARGAKVHILLIPQNFLTGDVENPHVGDEGRKEIKYIRTKNGLMKTILSLCRDNNLTCHDLLNLLTRDDYFKFDAHWSEQGHEKVGKYVDRIILEYFNQQR